jgi:hypothetical protein
MVSRYVIGSANTDLSDYSLLLSAISPASMDIEKTFPKRKTSIHLVSPLRTLAFNFRFNQFFGIFPGRISEDWTDFVIVKKLILLTFSIKAMFLTLILTLVYLWLHEQDIDFNIFINRILNHDGFTTTDTYAMISHSLFVQFSALILFLNNLNLGPELTKLVHCVLDFNNKYQGINPSSKTLMAYRYSICFLCTIASALLFTGVWSISANFDRCFGGLDFALLFTIVLALYVENQNHMFSELLFLRFTDILDERFNNLLLHLTKDHDSKQDRQCCVDHCDNIYKLYIGINCAFGADLLVSVTILIISITFGIYLVLTLTIFAGGPSREPIIFAAYFLYAFIPTLR